MKNLKNKKMSVKPNGVLCKTDLGELVVFLIKDGQWDFENVLKLNKDDMVDKYDDISAVNPFEWVFCIWGEDKLTTLNQKTIIPNTSFFKMHSENRLLNTIRYDYEHQFGKLNE